MANNYFCGFFPPLPGVCGFWMLRVVLLCSLGLLCWAIHINSLCEFDIFVICVRLETSKFSIGPLLIWSFSVWALLLFVAWPVLKFSSFIGSCVWVFRGQIKKKKKRKREQGCTRGRNSEPNTYANAQCAAKLTSWSVI